MVQVIEAMMKTMSSDGHGFQSFARKAKFLAELSWSGEAVDHGERVWKTKSMFSWNDNECHPQGEKKGTQRRPRRRAHRASGRAQHIRDPRRARTANLTTGRAQNDRGLEGPHKNLNFHWRGRLLMGGDAFSPPPHPHHLQRILLALDSPRAPELSTESSMYSTNASRMVIMDLLHLARAPPTREDDEQRTDVPYGHPVRTPFVWHEARLQRKVQMDGIVLDMSDSHHPETDMLSLLPSVGGAAFPFRFWVVLFFSLGGGVFSLLLVRGGAAFPHHVGGAPFPPFSSSPLLSVAAFLLLRFLEAGAVDLLLLLGGSVSLLPLLPPPSFCGVVLLALFLL